MSRSLKIDLVLIDGQKSRSKQGAHSFDEITYQVGYLDSSSFRKIFSKQTGLRPGEYQKKFQRI